MRSVHTFRCVPPYNSCTFWYANVMCPIRSSAFWQVPLPLPAPPHIITHIPSTAAGYIAPSTYSYDLLFAARPLFLVRLDWNQADAIWCNTPIWGTPFWPSGGVRGWSARSCTFRYTFLYVPNGSFISRNLATWTCSHACLSIHVFFHTFFIRSYAFPHNFLIIWGAFLKKILYVPIRSKRYPRNFVTSFLHSRRKS